MCACRPNQVRAAGGALSVGTYQSNQNAANTHTMTGAPGVGSLAIDSGGSHTHTATVTDPGHTHTYQFWPQTTAVIGSANFAQPTGTQSASTGSSVTGISVSNASAGAHTRTVSGTLTAGMLATASQGGTEARPEAAAVLFGVRY